MTLSKLKLSGHTALQRQHGGHFCELCEGKRCHTQLVPVPVTGTVTHLYQPGGEKIITGNLLEAQRRI